MLEDAVYIGSTVNFKTHKHSYKSKKRTERPREEWICFENTHEPIISQHDFDLVQEIRSHKCRPQRLPDPNPFSGIAYCADCGTRMLIARGKSHSGSNEHLKCGKNSHIKNACSMHFIRTCVLSEVVIGEINKILAAVHKNEDKFIRTAMENSASAHLDDVKKAKKTIAKYEKRISELDSLFTRLYEDNVLGKVSDNRFQQMSKSYEQEQNKLKEDITKLYAFVEEKEQKSKDISAFIDLVRNYEHITTLTPDIVHELIERIEIHAPDKSSGHRVQRVVIHFRFNVATTSALIDKNGIYEEKGLRSA